jgi:hypothetical protein
MLPFEALEFIGKIQRRQDRDINRADRIAIGADALDAFVDGSRHGLNPIVATVARDGQVLAHDLDDNAFHKSAKIYPIEPRQDFLDAALYFVAFSFVLLAFLLELLGLGPGIGNLFFGLSQAMLQLFIFTPKLLNLIDRKLNPFVEIL